MWVERGSGRNEEDGQGKLPVDQTLVVEALAFVLRGTEGGVPGVWGPYRLEQRSKIFAEASGCSLLCTGQISLRRGHQPRVPTGA